MSAGGTGSAEAGGASGSTGAQAVLPPPPLPTLSMPPQPASRMPHPVQTKACRSRLRHGFMRTFPLSEWVRFVLRTKGHSSRPEEDPEYKLRHSGLQQAPSFKELQDRRALENDSRYVLWPQQLGAQQLGAQQNSPPRRWPVQRAHRWAASPPDGLQPTRERDDAAASVPRRAHGAGLPPPGRHACLHSQDLSRGVPFPGHPWHRRAGI